MNSNGILILFYGTFICFSFSVGCKSLVKEKGGNASENKFMFSMRKAQMTNKL